MADHHDSLYHGRRTLDELAGALTADSAAAALAHKELSLLHLDRFVAAVTSLTKAIDRDRPFPAATQRFVRSPDSRRRRGRPRR